MAASREPFQLDISRATKECWEAFDRTLIKLNESPGHHQQYLDMLDEHEVFRAWVRTSGASGEDHASLDYRLRESLATRRLFITILEGLIVDHSRCIVLLRPRSPQTTSSPAPLKKSLSANVNSSSSDSEPSSDDSWDAPTVANFLHNISNSVDKLVQISRAIRKSSIQNRSFRAEAYEEWEDDPSARISKSKSFEDFIGFLLRYRYCNLHEDLRNRLRIAISRCHRRIAYQRRHQSKLHYGPIKDIAIPNSSPVTRAPKIPSSKISASRNESPRIPSHQADSLGDSAAVPSSLFSTISASTLSPTFNPFDYDEKSSVSSGSSSLRLTTNPKNDLPPPPALRGNERYFECPYCCIQSPRKKLKRRALVSHVISDLQPYICVFDECSLPNQSLESEDDWLKHERWNHNVSWSCNGFNTHPPVTFGDCGNFKHHFMTSHAGIVSSDGVDRLAETSAIPSSQMFERCPFCDVMHPINEGSGTQETSDLALPARSDIPDAASLRNTSKVDAETDRDPYDQDFDIINAEYVDQDYHGASLHQNDDVPEHSDEQILFVGSDEYPGHATNPRLRNFVRNAMASGNSAKAPNMTAHALAATSTMIEIVVMVLNGLDSLAELDVQQELLKSELLNSRHTLDYYSYIIRTGKNTAYLFKAFFVNHQLKQSTSLFAVLHKSIWASGFKLDIVNERGVVREDESENLLEIISTIQECRSQIAMKLTGKEYIGETDLDSRKTSQQAELIELQTKIRLRPEMHAIQLNLTHPGRDVIYRGVLFRKSCHGGTWVEQHAVLFDHFMVLTRVASMRDANNNSKEYYDVVRPPIPMVLLVLESTNEDPVEGHVRTHARNDFIWLFRLKHLGRDQTYTFCVATAEIRQDWCNKIIEAKSRHAISLYEQKAEPFQLEVVALVSFNPEGTTIQQSDHDISMLGHDDGTMVPDTTLYRALRGGVGIEHVKPRPVAYDSANGATINCATTFLDPYRGGSTTVVGTNTGVFTMHDNDPGSWTRATSSLNVSQFAVLGRLETFVLLADETLIVYPLDSICLCRRYLNLEEEGARKIGDEDVGFFAIGHMKDRDLMFYQVRDGTHSRIKVIELTKANSSATSSNAEVKLDITGTVDGLLLEDFDEFQIPENTSGIDPFRQSLSIRGASSFHIRSIDRERLITIPDLTAPDDKLIADRIQSLHPLRMLRLSQEEFLLVYNEVAVYVNRYGYISRSVIMKYVGSAKQACLVNDLYLVLVDTENSFVQVRNAINGRLKQIISGRDIRILDEQCNGSDGKVMIGMQHPDDAKSQLILAMVIDPEVKE